MYMYNIYIHSIVSPVLLFTSLFHHFQIILRSAFVLRDWCKLAVTGSYQQNISIYIDVGDTESQTQLPQYIQGEISKSFIP